MQGSAQNVVIATEGINEATSDHFKDGDGKKAVPLDSTRDQMPGNDQMSANGNGLAFQPRDGLAPNDYAARSGKKARSLDRGHPGNWRCVLTGMAPNLPGADISRLSEPSLTIVTPTPFIDPENAALRS